MEPGCGGEKGERETEIERERESQPRVCSPVVEMAMETERQIRESERANLGFEA